MEQDITSNPPDRSLSELGYDPDFLEVRVDLPTVYKNVSLLEVDGQSTIEYTRFTLAMNRNRKFAHWVAWNSATPAAAERAGFEPKLSCGDFHVDRRFADFQWGCELYEGNLLDRGHLARRADLTWPPDRIGDQADFDSHYFANIVPMAEDFNRSSSSGIWGKMENTIKARVLPDAGRVSVFAGPILKKRDQRYRNAQIPGEFWKVLAFVQDEHLFAMGFVLKQNVDRELDVDRPRARGRDDDFDPFRPYQRTIRTIGRNAQIRFPRILLDADEFRKQAAVPGSRSPQTRILRSVDDIEWGRIKLY